MKILNSIFPIFRIYEKDILDSIEAKLNFEAQAIYRNQIERIKFVQRFTKDKEVNMYYSKKRNSDFKEEWRFPLQLDEVQFAKLRITSEIDGKRKTLKATVWLVKGRIFSIDFNNPPRFLKKAQYTIDEVNILVDPMEKIEIKTISINTPEVWEWFGNLLDKERIVEIYAPVATAIQEKKIREFECNFPLDWLELLKYCDGLKLESCQVYGINSIRQIILEKENLLVMAEGIDAKMLVINQTINNGHIFFVDAEDDDAKLFDYGDSFHKAFARYLKND